MTSKEKLTTLFKEIPELSVKEITEKLGISKQRIHLILNRLVEERVIIKLGKAPTTVYRLNREEIVREPQNFYIPDREKKLLEKEFLIVTETGEMLEGVEGFGYWCKKRDLPVEKTIKEFISTKEKYKIYYNEAGIIDGMQKLRNTKGYEKIHLGELYYLDFYAIERFGKTRLGTLLHYAKQGQNKFLMKKMMEEIKDKIIDFVNSEGADAVGFVPPTIKREVQIMKFIKSELNISLPVIDIKKLSGIIPVPQKSLARLDERIINAENTFAVTEQRTFNKVILIDDAVGSGSTLNQIAGKIKAKKTAKYVVGLAIVGSFKGFDVITDV